MDENQDVPDMGETVVCKVKQVLNYGAFVELVEYGNRKGFVHISQVATRWVKNIRNFVKEGQVRAAKVLSINRERGQIDLSFTKVSSHAQRARIEEWKQLKRCRKLLEILAKEQHKTFEEAWEAIANPLLEKYDRLAEAFQEIALHEEAAAGVDSKWLKPLVEMVKKNVPPPEKTLKGTLSLRSFRPDGVDAIKQALLKAEKLKGKKIELFYSGGGKYALKATASDFKKAEKELNEAAAMVVETVKASDGEANFERAD